MTLDQWLEKKGICPAEFAREVDTDRSTISRLVRFISWPRLDLAKRISKATGGKVSWDEHMAKVSYDE
jgi:hypothetical protein